MFKIGDKVLSAIGKELATSTTSASIILITGVNKSIGFETAQQFGKAGNGLC
jgi:NADP-dependent 3-hydroxy acid dehydrogenase YdfG